uniref:Centrosomal AT-AC splicing factor n=1 Tax=Cyprinus carpio carpio TaxID=630221 RepID=A0A9J8AG27_CYPCA
MNKSSNKQFNCPSKRTIKSPQVEKYSPDHDEKFWCYCCVLEMQKHVTDCNISVLYGGLLEHKSTPEHRTNTHKFWWDYKADPELRDKFIITEEETPRGYCLLIYVWAHGCVHCSISAVH